MSPSIDDINRDDTLLDVLGARLPYGGSDPAGALLEAWVGEIDRSVAPSPPRPVRRRGRTFGVLMSLSLTFAGGSIAAAFSGADLPVFSAVGHQLVDWFPLVTLDDDERGQVEARGAEDADPSTTSGAPAAPDPLSPWTGGATGGAPFSAYGRADGAVASPAEWRPAFDQARSATHGGVTPTGPAPEPAAAEATTEARHPSPTSRQGQQGQSSQQSRSSWQPTASEQVTPSKTGAPGTPSTAGQPSASSQQSQQGQQTEPTTRRAAPPSSEPPETASPPTTTSKPTAASPTPANKPTKPSAPSQTSPPTQPKATPGPPDEPDKASQAPETSKAGDANDSSKAPPDQKSPTRPGSNKPPASAPGGQVEGDDRAAPSAPSQPHNDQDHDQKRSEPISDDLNGSQPDKTGRNPAVPSTADETPPSADPTNERGPADPVAPRQGHARTSPTDTGPAKAPSAKP